MNIIRWIARILGTLMVAFTVLIAVGSIIEEQTKPAMETNAYTLVLFIVWGAALLGLIIALWKEGLGGIISLVCFILLNILAAINPTPGSRYTYILLLFMIPSVLFLYYWWPQKKCVRSRSAP